jgi:class 3 adenylate cyclase
MFHFSDPGEAILSGLDLIEQTESAIESARAHRHPRRRGHRTEGDYFGRTLNIAARIPDYARPHEPLMSEEARLNSSVGHVAFELIGDVSLKGVSQAVRLHRATRLGD